MLRVVSRQSERLLVSLVYQTNVASKQAFRCLATGPVLADKSDGVPSKCKTISNSQPYSQADIIVQGLQGRDVEFSTSQARTILAEAVGQSNMSPREREDCVRQGIQDCPSVEYNQAGNVSLYSCMQSTVPHPYQSSRVTHLNMPGGGQQQQSKFLSSNLQSLHWSKVSRGFSTYSTLRVKVSPDVGNGLAVEEPCPQGVQGDECVRYKLWKDNCVRFQLANCDEQLQSFQSGRKTLSEIFGEQNQVIRDIVQQYQSEGLSSQSASTTGLVDHDNSSRQNSEDFVGLRELTVQALLEENYPCPQGIQGQDCEQFKEWLHNCNRYQLSNCEDQLRSVQQGRRTLAQIIQEQEQMIASIARQYRTQARSGAQAERD